MDDIYGDLDDFNFSEELDKVRAKNESLHDELNELKRLLQETTEKCSVLEKENDQLKVNISTLFKTAQSEVTRKDETINQLRTELEDVKFRRFRSQNNRGTNFNHVKSRLVNNRYYHETNNPKVYNPNIPPPICDVKRESEYTRPKDELSEYNNGQDPKLDHTDKDDNSNTNAIIKCDITQSRQETRMKWTLRPVSPSPKNESNMEIDSCSVYEKTIKTESDVDNKQIVTTNEIVKVDRLESGVKKEVVENRNSETDDNQKRKRSPSPSRSNKNHESLHANKKKCSVERNARKLISRSRSRESNRSFNRRSPNCTKRMQRDNDYGRDRHHNRSRITQVEYHDKNQPSNRKFDDEKESRFRYNNREAYRRDDPDRNRRHNFENWDSRRRHNKYDKRSPSSHYEHKDQRKKSENFTERSSSKNVHSKDSRSGREIMRSYDKRRRSRERRPDNFNVRRSSDKKTHSEFNEKRISPVEIVSHISNDNIGIKQEGGSSNNMYEQNFSGSTNNSMDFLAVSLKNVKQKDHDEDSSQRVNTRKKVLSLGEYNKRHKSEDNLDKMLESDVKYTETAKGDSGYTSVSQENSCSGFKHNKLSEEHFDKEDGEIGSETELTFPQESANGNYEKSVEIEIKHQRNIIPHKIQLSTGEQLNSEKRTKKKKSDRKNIHVQKMERGIRFPFSNEANEMIDADDFSSAPMLGTKGPSVRVDSIRESKYISPLSKLLSDVANETCATLRNVKLSSEIDGSNNLEHLKPHDKENLTVDRISDTSKDRKYKSNSRHRAKRSQDNLSSSTTVHMPSSETVDTTSTVNIETEIQANEVYTPSITVEARLDTKNSMNECTIDKSKKKFKIPKINKDRQIGETLKDKSDMSSISTEILEASNINCVPHLEEAVSEYLKCSDSIHMSNDLLKNICYTTQTETSNSDGINQLLDAAKLSDLNDITLSETKRVENTATIIDEYPSETSPRQNNECDTKTTQDSDVYSSGISVDPEVNVQPVEKSEEIINTMLSDEVKKISDKKENSNTVHIKISRRRNVAIKSNITK